MSLEKLLFIHKREALQTKSYLCRVVLDLARSAADESEARAWADDSAFLSWAEGGNGASIIAAELKVRLQEASRLW